MRLVLATVAALLAAPGAHAADVCNRYVHETEDDTWIIDLGKELVWHKPDGEERFLKAYRAPASTYSLAATPTDDEGFSEEIPFRFETIGGRKTLIWAVWFYYNSCPETKS